MAKFTSITSESVQVGTAPLPPIATVDIWQSLDPTIPFSIQNWGISNFQGLHNQIGLYNGIGAKSQLGIMSLLGFKSQVGGQVHAEPSSNAAAVQMAFSSPQIIQATSLNVSGTITQNGTPVQLTSDIKNKINIKPLENSLEKVLQLKGVEYDRTDFDIHEIGLIAQEVQEVIPDLVTEDDTNTKLVHYKNLTALLVEAVKEQQEQINSLKQTVEELSTKLAECCS